jgi:endo-1,3(4)-beta-glucanase
MKLTNSIIRAYALIALSVLIFPGLLQSQIITVGSGSYTTLLPLPDAAGRNVNPTGIPRVSGIAATKPIASSDWWTGLLTFDGANLYNYPLTMKGVSNGLVMSYTFLGLGANDTRQPMSPDQPLVLGVSGLAATYPTVSDYSDWTVTASWNNGDHNFSAIMGMGMPFAYCTKGNADIASVTINIGTVVIQNEMILVTKSLSGANFAIYAPLGSSWIQSGKTYTSTLNGKNYFSAVMLPSGVAAATVANDFKQYAYVFPANTAVSWKYDNTSSTLQTTFTVTPDQKEGTGNNVLMGLLPHQWAHLAASSAQPGSYNYITSRGTMKMLASNTFLVENKFKGILSTLPNLAKYSPGFNPGALNAKIDQVKGGALDVWTDSYNDGLAMNRLIQVAKIADQIGYTEARDQIVNTVRIRLENWFKATSGEKAFLFSYNKTWSSLIGYPAGYYSDSNLNDHHFHYGYFITAAAAVEQFQPGWAAKWGGMVELLAKDAGNGDRTDTKFPFLRNFNPYAGHSFASGLLNNEPHGNNQECSSEAMNFNSSLINWGTLTGNTDIRDLGIYLYTTEQTAIEEYWFDMRNRNFSQTYSQMMCSRVWGNGYDRGTFWTNDIAAMYGIEMFPLTGASLYLGQNTSYVKQLWNDMKAKTDVIAMKPNDNLWYDIYWSYLALADPATAVALYDKYPGYKVKGGCSDAQTYHWLHSFNGLGQVDASVTADYPIAAVFSKNGDKTYVAQNYGSDEITVTYSDGYSMAVPARALKTSKDIGVSVLLNASSLQVGADGTLTLSATVTGDGITKVEFYDNTDLVGTSTTTPYSVDLSNLKSKTHGFYAKVFVGSSFNLSNILKLTGGITGISDLEYSKLDIYPNPTNKELIIEGLSKPTTVTIFDLTGKAVYRKAYVTNKIDISNLAIGIYTIKIVDNQRIATGKFVKQ